MARKPRIRFEQARSIGIILTLGALLALIVYNTLSEGHPWTSRAADVRLLMTILSILLGLDVIGGNRKEILDALGRALVSVAGGMNDTTARDERKTKTDADAEADTDAAAPASQPKTDTRDDL